MFEVMVVLGLIYVMVAFVWLPLRQTRAAKANAQQLQEGNRRLILLNATMREFGESILAHGDLTPEQQDRLRSLMS